MMSSTKRRSFDKLANEAFKCTICPELADKDAVFSELNGSLNPKVLFIAEAPGRQGADRTRRPFWGDKSGENFQLLIDSIALKRKDIFITNAVLCSPRKQSGANRKPKKSEINNCTGYLKRTIELIDPPVIVPLGTVALDALKAISPHEFSLKENVAQEIHWNGYEMIPLYHPSPQVFAMHRRREQQLEDYKILGRQLKSNV